VLFLAVTNDFGHVTDLYHSLLTKTGPKPKNKTTITPLSLGSTLSSLWRRHNPISPPPPPPPPPQVSKCVQIPTK
jgi:hypothetical protein